MKCNVFFLFARNVLVKPKSAMLHHVRSFLWPIRAITFAWFPVYTVRYIHMAYCERLYISFHFRNDTKICIKYIYSFQPFSLSFFFLCPLFCCVSFLRAACNILHNIICSFSSLHQSNSGMLWSPCLRSLYTVYSYLYPLSLCLGFFFSRNKNIIRNEQRTARFDFDDGACFYIHISLHPSLLHMTHFKRVLESVAYSTATERQNIDKTTNG